MKREKKSVEFERLGVADVTHLIKHGAIHCNHPSSTGNERKLPHGASMQAEIHRSPITFANEVKISAKTMSEKWICWFIGEKKHR
jgi:hypothetical protein